MERPEREAMEFDVVIAGGGPAGLATAIRLKQVAAEQGREISVVVVEKGSEIGAHILSGAVIDPVGLDALLPDWRQAADRPQLTEVTRDEFLVLGAGGGIRLPNALMPRIMSNHGNLIGSLGDVTRWLGQQAEALGVEIYPGFPAAEVLVEDGIVVGIATGDMGVARDGELKDDFTRGMELRGRYTVLAEGARGSLTKQVIARFRLNEGRDHQKYGLGVKEVWRVAPERFRLGLIQHSMGWPLSNDTGGGSWLYHYGDGLVSVGFVVHLNYANPTLSPFSEMQRFKTHPMIRETFEGGRRLSYGARAIMEGGWQSVPKLVFPGGALVGDSAGFVNVPRIKGSHNAVLSGTLCAEHLAAALAEGRGHDEVAGYEQTWRQTSIGRDLYAVRNVKPLWSRFGTVPGIGLGALDMWAGQLLGMSPFGTLRHGKADHEATKPLADVKPIVYPKPDGVLTFDRLSSVYLSNTNHEEDQPVHLRVADMELQKRSEHDVYGGPSRHYCPAGVYEWLEEPRPDGSGKTEQRFVINAQNCVHCKTCDIKDPNANITWVTPEGSGGPNYPSM